MTSIRCVDLPFFFFSSVRPTIRIELDMQVARDLNGSIFLGSWGGAFDVADDLALGIVPGSDQLRVEGAFSIDDLKEFRMGRFVGLFDRLCVQDGVFFGVLCGWHGRLEFT